MSNVAVPALPLDAHFRRVRCQCVGRLTSPDSLYGVTGDNTVQASAAVLSLDKNKGWENRWRPAGLHLADASTASAFHVVGTVANPC